MHRYSVDLVIVRHKGDVQMKLTKDFYKQANRIVLDALRRKIVVFPDNIGERKEYIFKKVAAVCIKCGCNYKKNVSIQKYCRECGEIESRERYFKRKNNRANENKKA